MTRSRAPRRAVGAAGAIVAAACLAAACTDDDPPSPTTSVAATTTTTIVPRSDDGVLRIGAYLPQTGPGAALGIDMLEAVEQSVALVNQGGGVLGRRVTWQAADEGAGTGMDDLLDAGVDAVIGPASSLVALSQLDATVQPETGVVTCSPSASALSLDDYPDNDYFFRTIPSDSLQMVAIARRAALTGVTSVAIGYLDDPYGRGLADALTEELESNTRIEIVANVPFSGVDEDLSGAAAAVLDRDPGLVVVLGDADDGSRFLAALDVASAESTRPPVIVNDALRTARQTIQGLSPGFRGMITGIAPRSESIGDGPAGAFAGHAADCVNMIALAAEQVGSDAPRMIRTAMPSVSAGGRVCMTFLDCSALIEQGLNIDYNGLSGSIELSATTGDPQRAWFEIFMFDDEGVDYEPESGSPFEVF